MCCVSAASLARQESGFLWPRPALSPHFPLPLSLSLCVCMCMCVCMCKPGEERVGLKKRNEKRKKGKSKEEACFICCQFNQHYFKGAIYDIQPHVMSHYSTTVIYSIKLGEQKIRVNILLLPVSRNICEWTVEL